MHDRKVPVGRQSRRSTHRQILRAAVEALESRTLLAADVLSYHNDAASTGLNPSETLLTPSNVNTTSFGKRYSTAVDGQVYAQPLYVSNLTVNGASHNVVYVATEHDSLYAIDGDSGAILWQKSFINPAAGITTVPAPTDVSTSDLTPEIGITATPVIDRSAGVIFVSAKSKQIVNNDTAHPHYLQTLYRVSLTDGSFTSVVMADTTNNGGGSYTYNTGPYVVGTGDGAITVTNAQGQSEKRVYFNALRQFNRSALLLYNGQVYVASASHGDNGPYHGWILGYNSTTLANTAALCLTPNGGLGGIWQAGGAIAMDPQGYMYIETGNGTFDTSLTFNTALNKSFPSKGDYGDSFVKIAVDSTTTQTSQNINGFGLKVVDYFTPFNQSSLNSADVDLGSGAPMVLPDSVGSAAHPHLLVGAGKEGKIYLIDRDNMGQFSTTTDNVVQEQGSAMNRSLDTPAFFNDGTTSRIYYVGDGDFGKTFTIANGAFSTAPDSKTATKLAFPGSTPSITSNGNNNGIVWDLDRSTNSLRAYSASNYGQELWNTTMVSGDALGSVVKFSVATPVNGHVYVGTTNALVAYGPPVPPTTIPADPTVLIGTPVSAVEIDLSWTDNAVNEDGYYVEQSNDNGNSWTQIATLGVNAQFKAVTGLSAGQTYTFRVRAFNALGKSNYSNTVTKTTSSQVPSINFASGFANSSGTLKLNGAAAIVGTKLELTSGGGNQTGSAFSASPLSIQRFSTTFTLQPTNANADGLTFTLQNVANTALGAGGQDLGYANIASSIAIKFDLFNNAGEGNNTTGLFVGGAHPTLNANTFDMTSSGVNLHSGRPLTVTLSYDGTNLQESVSDAATGAVYTHTYTINIPATIGATTAYVGFTGATGGSTAIQDVVNWTYTPFASSAPAAPTITSITPASGTQLNLSWSEPAGQQVDGYKILRTFTADGTYTEVSEVSGTQQTYMDAGLTPATEYYYKVVATNSVGDSSPSLPAHFATPFPPPTPSNAHPTLVGSNEVDLAWNDNSFNEDDFKILRKIADDNDNQFIQIAVLPADTNSYQDKTVKPGTSYDYHIQAHNIAGYSDFTGSSVTTLTAAPSLQGAPGNGKATLTWNVPNGAQTYNVYRSTQSGQATASAPIAHDLTSPTFTDNSAANGTTYYYQVTATNEDSAESSASNEVGVTPSATTPVDQTPPSAALSAPTLSSAGGATYTFTVTYTDNVAVSRSSLGNQDIVVTGPGNYSAAATLTGPASTTDGATIVATYTVPAPSSTWAAANNGTYTVSLQASQVLDTSANAAAAASLGTFQVSIATGAGPLAQYNFDETGGTTASDASGNGNTATLVNGPTFVAASHGGTTSNALSLNGSNQYAQVPSNTSLNPTSAITLSGWINVTDWNGNRRILQKGATDNQYRLLAENGRLVFDLKGVGTLTATLPGTGAWHLVTGTWDGSTMILYVDGKSVASAAHTGSIAATSDPLVIGNKNTTSTVAGDLFKGQLDDVRIYNRALSPSEITDLYGTPVVVPPPVLPALAAQYQFDETGGASAGDASGNGNVATLINGPTFVAASYSGSAGNALSFNGTNQYARVNDSSALDPTSAITLSGWVNATDWNGNRRILQKGSNDNQYRLLAEGGRLVFDLTGVGNVTATLPGTGGWHLVTGTWDGSTMTLYVDGKAVASAARTGSIAVTADPLVMGNKNTTSTVGGDLFKGLLDDVRIYTRALSAAEVSSLYGTPVVPPPPVLPTLLARYLFDETGGTTSADASGNNNTATLVNNAALVLASRNGGSGNAISVNGTNQYARIADSATLSPTAAITLSAWINPTDWNGNRRILQKGAGDNQYRLLAENGRLVLDLKGVGNVTANLPAAGSWHLVTGTWDGSTMTLYVDGVAAGSAAHAGTLATTGDPLVIGAKNTTATVAGDFFKGLIDDVRVYSVALSASDVQSLFAAG